MDDNNNMLFIKASTAVTMLVASTAAAVNLILHAKPNSRSRINLRYEAFK
jgi:hypothetical protein